LRLRRAPDTYRHRAGDDRREGARTGAQSGGAPARTGAGSWRGQPQRRRTGQVGGATPMPGTARWSRRRLDGRWWPVVSA
jgi:hypothetical protein